MILLPTTRAARITLFGQGDRRHHDGDGRTGKQHPATFHLAQDIAAPPGDLPGGKDVLAKSIAPVRRQRAMRRAGDRVFGNAEFGRKEAADKVDVAAGRGHDHSAQIEPAEQSVVGVDGDVYKRQADCR